MYGLSVHSTAACLISMVPNWIYKVKYVSICGKGKGEGEGEGRNYLVKAELKTRTDLTDLNFSLFFVVHMMTEKRKEEKKEKKG